MKEVMSYHNGHDVELVKQIEIIFNNEGLKWSGLIILEALCKRYAQEVYDKLGLAFPTTSEVAKHRWEILSEICDDEDLKRIIYFVL